LEPLEARNLLTNSLVFVPSPVVNDSDLLATAAIAHNDIWAVGRINTSSGASATLAEHFDGTSWSVVPTPSISDSLVSVAAAASNDVWAIGNQIFVNDAPTPFFTHWDGTSWSVVDSPKLPKNSFLTAITAPASNNAWAVGNTFSSPTGIFEHWDGTQWRILSSPAFTNLVAFAIAADSSTDVWAFGISNVTGGPVALHFNGSNWTAIPAANSRLGFRVGGLAALSPTNVWAAGAQADSDHDATVPAAEHWDGTSWSLVSVPNPNPNTSFNIGLSGIAAISANDIWAVGSFPVIGGEQTLTEHWDGTSWSITASPNPGKVANSLEGVSALGDGTVVAVGRQLSSKNATGLILQNAASAPKGATTAAVSTGTIAMARTTSAPLAVSLTAFETQNAVPTAPMPAIPRDAVPVDWLLAALAKPLQSLLFISHGSGTHQTAMIWDLDLLPEEIGLFDWA
jgi:hypothetical protein